jgi:hypothetical protein
VHHLERPLASISPAWSGSWPGLGQVLPGGSFADLVVDVLDLAEERVAAVGEHVQSVTEG